MLLLSILLVTASGLSATGVPHPLRSAIVARSVGYEKAFASRKDTAIVAVVGGKSGASAEHAHAVAGLLSKLTSKAPIAGRPTRVVHVTHETNDGTLAQLREFNADIVYLAPGISSLIPAIPTKQDSKKRILVCGAPDDVPKGCTLGVELADNKPRLILNLKQANKAGLRFAPQFLRLARILR